jgi:hypothetical protein
MFHRQEDYIIRMISMIGPFVATLLKLRRTKDHSEGHVLITSTTKDTIGLDLPLVQKLTPQAIMHMLNVETTQGAAKCLVLTDILREAAQLYDDEERTDEAYAHYLKAFELYDELFAHSDVDLEDYLPASELAERDQTMLTVADRLRALGASGETVLRTFMFYNRHGAFAKAEDALFDLLDEHEDDSDLLETGIAFYNRLLAMTDVDLNAGGLPRDEVNASLAELSERLVTLSIDHDELEPE